MYTNNMRYNMKIKYLLFSLVLFVVLSIGIGYTFSFFVPQISGSSELSSLVISNKNIVINYNNNSSVLIDSDNPSVTKFIEVTNNNLTDMEYYLEFTNVSNTFNDYKIVNYSYECTSSISTCESKSGYNSPYNDSLLTNPITIGPGEKHSYEINISIVDIGLIIDPLVEQLECSITAKELHYSKMIPVAYSESFWNTTGYFWSYKYEITKVTFERNIDVPLNAIDSWDISLL